MDTVQEQTGKPARHIMIVAGEASGDIHGANLVREMLLLEPNLRFSGMGGASLAESGVEILYDAASMAVVGVVEVISHLGDILRARKVLIEQMQNDPPALLILIDYPDFNLLLAAKAKKLGIPVYYYISPQIWAWRTGRVHKIARLTKRVGVILPFEKDFYQNYGVEVDFVGHPLVDSVTTTCSKKAFRKNHAIPEENLVVGLLPGSRKKEVSSLLPDFLAAAKLLADGQDKNITFLVPQAPTITLQLLKDHGLDRFGGQIDCKVITENRYDMMQACDAVVAASGTITLELAILGTPTLVTYRVSPRTYRLGRMLVRHLDFFSLVNLIGGREIIPELLQDEVTPEAISATLHNILTLPDYRDTMEAGLLEVKNKLGQPGASRRAAASALSVLSS